MGSEEREKLRPALEVVVKMVEQWCQIITDKDDEPAFDSGAYSANAAAMRFLAEHGLMSVQFEVGRRVIARWTDAARDFGADHDFSFFKQLREERRNKPASSPTPETSYNRIVTRPHAGSTPKKDSTQAE
jgi:hypothetical protein